MRYFFDLHEADGIALDIVGTELLDHAMAERRAIHTMGSIAADYCVAGQFEEFSVEVGNEGAKVLAVHLKLEVVRH